MTAEIPSRPLGLTRIIVGAACTIRALLAWPSLAELASPETFRAPYADWLPDPTLVLVTILVTVWGVSGVLFTLGWRVPLVGSLLVIAIALNLALDQQTYDNHVYMMVWLVFLLTVADAGAGLAIRSEDRPVVRWGVLLLMVQLSVVYGFAGLTKLNSIFLSGAGLAGVLGGGLIPFPESLRTPQVLPWLAAAVIFVELFVAIMVWRPRFRPAAFVLGFGLHIAIVLLMESTAQLLVFMLVMLALYPLFLDTKTLVVAAPGGFRLTERIRRFDLLETVRFSASADKLTLAHHDEVTTEAAAHTRILEHLVPWLWIAPMLRVPGVSHLHKLWFGRRPDPALSSSPRS